MMMMNPTTLLLALLSLLSSSSMRSPLRFEQPIVVLRAVPLISPCPGY